LRRQAAKPDTLRGMRELALPCPPHSFDEPSARPDRRRPQPVIPVHVCLKVRVDPRDGTVKGRVEHTVRARATAVHRLTLDAADLEVHLALNGDGDTLEHHAHAGGIDITFAEPIAPGTERQFALDFTATPTAGMYFMPAEGDRPAQAWTQGAMEDHHHWFPCFDAPEHMVTSEVIATVPEGYTAVSNGVPVDGPDAPDGWSRFHWHHDTPHALYLLTLVVDELSEVRDDSGPVPTIHYVPPGREADAEQIFARMSDMFAWFGESTGVPYPYPRYGHVFLRRFMWGGMENTTLTSLTDQVLVPGELRDDFDVERLVAHELAHQWFGDLIAPRGWPEIWLNESFASYFEILCMEALNGDDDLHRRLLVKRDSYFSEAANRYQRPVVTRTYAHPYVLFDRHAYEKGCLILHTLRAQLGETAFWTGLSDYVKGLRGKAAETADFRSRMEAASGVDLSDFFEQFIYGAGHPSIAMAWTFDPQVGLELTLTRTDDGPQTLYVDVQVQGAERQTIRVRIAAETRTLVLPMTDAPRWVAVDPEQHCLLRINEQRETTTTLLARMVHDTHPMLRARTARVLAQRADARVTACLADALRDDPSQTVRLEAAKALGQHRTPAALDALADAIDSDQHWRVKAAAARAFGPGADRGQVPALEAWLQKDQRFPVKCALLAAVGKVRDPAATLLAETHLDADSPRDCVAIAAINALASQDRIEALDTLMVRTEPTYSRGLRSAALVGAATLAKSNDKEKRRVREVLERALNDEIFQVRLAATRGLKTLGDAKAKPALERAHGAERSGLIRRFHREALGAL
jgi:aminopeptidase N